MPVLLRCPAAVPALFSEAVEPEPPKRHRAIAGRDPTIRGFPLGAASVFAAVALIEVPLVKAVAALVGLGLRG